MILTIAPFAGQSDRPTRREVSRMKVSPVDPLIPTLISKHN